MIDEVLDLNGKLSLICNDMLDPTCLLNNQGLRFFLKLINWIVVTISDNLAEFFIYLIFLAASMHDLLFEFAEDYTFDYMNLVLETLE